MKRASHPVLGAPAPLLVAHRGVPAVAPENSAAALLAAREARARVVELDARPAADDLLVVLHDPSPRRLTGRSGAAERLSSAVLTELAYREAPLERILLLDEALAILAGRTTIDIELKVDGNTSPAEIARRLLAALERAGSPRDLLVTSDSVEMLREIEARAALITTGLVFRSGYRLGPIAAIERALASAASFIVANHRRIDADMLDRAREKRLVVWAYCVNELGLARRLLALGCQGLITDDYPRLARELRVEPGPQPRVESRVEPDGQPAELERRPTLLAIDLGSTRTKLARVDPREGIVAQLSAPTPVRRPGKGLVEHDALEQLQLVERLLAKLAEEDPTLPAAAALASQRSTGLLVGGERLEPLTPALSWQDERGRELVSRLASEREPLEAVAGLPLAAAWTAVKGSVLLAGRPPKPDERLLPLGSFVAARLTRSAARIDPTLANRTFLIDAASGRWSERLLAAFGLTTACLPALVPTIAEHGALPWPAGGEVPLRVLIGDQQAAYVGAAGATGTRLVLNLGTAGFALKSRCQRGRTPPGGRVAPLWTSASRPRPLLYLAEIPVSAPQPVASFPSAAAAAMETARRRAFGDAGLSRFANELAGAARQLAEARDRSVLLAGALVESPHWAALLCSVFRRAQGLEPAVARERELTLLGAARLAAAAAGLVWTAPLAGGISLAGPPTV
ncbi:MAG: hypothetical protein JSV80_14455 [Acidobacteriota bacterium]|nr:MAG: hypothetical protein JSV80_14455 [Acidobacteriota bacterium]